jgi:hypothetical protein
MADVIVLISRWVVIGSYYGEGNGHRGGARISMVVGAPAGEAIKQFHIRSWRTAYGGQDHGETSLTKSVARFILTQASNAQKRSALCSNPPVAAVAT